MFNGVDGKGFARATKVIVMIIQELKPIIWFISVSGAVLLFIDAIAPNGFF